MKFISLLISTFKNITKNEVNLYTIYKNTKCNSTKKKYCNYVMIGAKTP